MPRPFSFHRLPYGPGCLFFDFSGTPAEELAGLRRAVIAALEAEPPFALEEFSMGIASVLLEFERTPQGEIEEMAEPIRLRLQNLEPVPASAGRLVEIPVRYGGPDLAAVAARSGLGEDEVVLLHSSTEYEVAVVGFSPGFAYLEGLDPRLHTPRLAVPRPKVEAGSVGIGGRFTGIYPQSTPGGWNLIGRTEEVLFDPFRDPVCLLRAGDRVRFKALR